MHGTLNPPAPRRRGLRLPLTLRLALRELRGGLSGFAVFLACLALGVAAIAGVSSLSRSLTEGIAREGRRILGADIALALVQREATPQEKAFLAARGDLSTVATLRAMASAGDKGAALVELKAVDGHYPVVGSLVSEPQAPLPDLLVERDGAWGAVADPLLLARLDLKVGDRVKVGEATVQIRAALVSEPDALGSGIGFGPRLLVSQAALGATGLIQPGSLSRWTYRLTLPGTDDAGVERAQAAIEKGLPDAGFLVRTRLKADPRFQNSVERFTQFLTLVGLTALLVGGVGVANAVRGFVERKRASIATLKSLGAPGGRVVAIYLTEVMLIALVGIVVGLGVGAALPFAVNAGFSAVLPVPLDPTLAWGELALAALYGVLTALAFAIAPLGRAHDVGVAGLFRDAVDPERRSPRPRYRVVLALAAAALVVLAVVTAFDRAVALMFVAAAALSFACLRGLSAGTMALARRLPRPRRAAPRLALANLHRPGALTPSIVLSLGLGITLLVTLSVIDANLTRALTRSLPAQAPSLFFLDIPSRDAGAFADFLARSAPEGKLERVPMMRGRITALAGTPVGQVKADEKAAWVLDGDRGITYATSVPDGSTIAEGAWWPEDYAGPPLVSFEQDVARGLGLKLGDTVTVNVLGHTITARIANLRKVEWRSLGINFVMVFSPDTFAGAPHSDLATLTLPGGGDPARETAILRDAARQFPTVTSVRVKEALDAVNDLVGKLVLAIRGASGVALAASVLVLAGALAAGHRARLYDAVVLKTLGATRARLLTAYALEYGSLGIVTALFGLVAGTLAAYLIVTRVMRLDFALDLSSALVAAIAAVVVTVTLGLAGTWRILSQKPAGYLRSL